MTILSREYTVEEPYGGNRSRNAIEHKKTNKYEWNAV